MATFSVDGYIKHIDSVINKLQNELETTLREDWALDMRTRIVERVELDSKTAKGGKFSDYSPNYLKWKKKKKGFLGTDKNFALTRTMWSKFNITNTSRKEGFFEVTLAGTSPDGQDKINWNSKREEISIIEASKEDQEAQDAFLQKWLNEFLRREL